MIKSSETRDGCNWMTSLIEDRRKRQGTKGTHSLESQKAHATGEFVIVK